MRCIRGRAIDCRETSKIDCVFTDGQQPGYILRRVLSTRDELDKPPAELELADRATRCELPPKILSQSSYLELNSWPQLPGGTLTSISIPLPLGFAIDLEKILPLDGLRSSLSAFDVIWLPFHVRFNDFGAMNPSQKVQYKDIQTICRRTQKQTQTSWMLLNRGRNG